MGNPKLRLSKFIPSAWFHKLNDMGNPKIKLHPQPTKRNHPAPPFSAAGRATGVNPASELHGELPLSLSPPRKSYHFTRNLRNPKSLEFDTPRKSSGRRIRRRPTTQKSSPSESFTQMVAFSSNSRNFRDNSVIREERKAGDSVSTASRVELRPIKTEREKLSGMVKKMGGAREAIDDQKRSSDNCRGRRANGSLSVSVVKEESAMASPVCRFKEQGNRTVRRQPNGSPRVGIRIHSPRIARRVQVSSSKGSSSTSPSKKGVSSKSLAVVKSSSDPERDFRESMAEMIVENNIRAPNDLEELLACYLSLNSEQYHGVIIQAFTHIWFHLDNIMKEVKR